MPRKQPLELHSTLFTGFLRKGIRVVVGTLSALILLVVNMAGQTTSGTILGTVFDSSGAVVASAKITVVNLGTDQARTEDTNSSGVYMAQELVAVTHRARGEGVDFKSFVDTGLTLESQTMLRVNAKLVVGKAGGGANETIEVRGTAPVITTETGTVTAQVEKRA